MEARRQRPADDAPQAHGSGNNGDRRRNGGRRYTDTARSRGGEDAPLSLKDALCLPELGGGGPGIPSRTISVKNLRAEIDAGRLWRVAPFDKNWRVSRRTLKEWLELRHTDDMDQFPASAKTSIEVQDIRKRQKGTRSSLAADRVEKSMNAVDAARLRIQQGRDRLK